MIKFTTTIFESITFIDTVRIVGMISLWFTLGIVIYLFLLNRRPKSVLLEFINNLPFPYLVLVLFLIFKFISLLFSLTVNIFLIDLSIINDILNLNLNIISESGVEPSNTLSNPSTTGSTANNPTPSTSSTTESVAAFNPTPPSATSLLSCAQGPKEGCATPTVPTNMSDNMAGVILTTALAGGLKLAHNASGVTGKIAIVGASIAGGATGIIGANIVNESSANILKKNLLLDNTGELAALLGLTGNSSYDLILIIYLLHKLQLFILYFIGYNALLLYLNNDKVNLFLKNRLSLEVYNRVYKYLNYMSKSSKFLIGIFFVLIVIFSMLNLYFLGFYVENFERLCELYFEYKSNK